MPLRILLFAFSALSLKAATLLTPAISVWAGDGSFDWTSAEVKLSGANVIFKGMARNNTRVNWHSVAFCVRAYDNETLVIPSSVKRRQSVVPCTFKPTARDFHDGDAQSLMATVRADRLRRPPTDNETLLFEISYLDAKMAGPESDTENEEHYATSCDVLW